MSSGPAPRVSVVMPMRDAAAYLAEAIESVLAQTFGDFEFLIFDDGSSDASCAIADGYAKADPRIQLYRGSHAGLAAWLREGVLRARGELIARMDADDYAHPERFARLVQYLDAHPECVAVASDVLLVDPERRPIQRLPAPRTHEETEQALWRAESALPCPVLRRRAVLEAGNYRTDRNATEDSDLYLRLAEIGRLANVSEVLYEYRRHETSICSAQRLEQSRMHNVVRSDALRRRGLPASQLIVVADAPNPAPHDLWHEWSRAALGDGYLDTSRYYARRLLRAEPFALRSWRTWLRAALGIRLGRLRRREPRRERGDR
jgi:glycosyltransferase involved in cell wall biosynthesis